MIKNLLFIVISPFNKRDYDRFGIKLLKQNGFKVIVWDLTPLARPKLSSNYKPPDPIEIPDYSIFKNKTLFLSKIKNLHDNTFVFTPFHYTKKSYFIYRALSNNNLKYAVFMALAIPSVKKSKQEKISDFIEKISDSGLKDVKKNFNGSYNYISNRVFHRIPPSFFGIKPASLILAGGEKSLNYPCPKDESTEVLWAHTLDYDLYLKEKKHHSTKKDIAVFIDQYLPFHPDNLTSGQQSPVDSDIYYSLLNNFFDKLEEETNLKVVIAVHPRSHYEKHPNYFKNRKCVRGKTVRLVKESQLVLSHFSTSLNLANLFYKPVIFLTSSNLDKSWQGSLIRVMADWFGKKPVFIDTKASICWEKQMKINKNKYKNYRRAYVKTDNSEQIPFWQIVANRLKKQL